MRHWRIVAFVAPLAVVTAVIVAMLAPAGKSGTFFLALAPFVLLLTARWALHGEDLAQWVLRSVAAHLVAVMTTTVLMVLARSTDPGASAHGGVVLMLVLLLPMSFVIGKTVGVFASVLAFGARSS